MLYGQIRSKVSLQSEMPLNNFPLGQVTSGATSDLKHATKQARHMIMECGMSNEIGPVYVSDEKSAETRKIIDSEITRMLRDAHKRVTDMLVIPSHSPVEMLQR